jgi:hypothetical protein
MCLYIKNLTVLLFFFFHKFNKFSVPLRIFSYDAVNEIQMTSPVSYYGICRNRNLRVVNKIKSLLIFIKNLNYLRF